LRNCSGQSTASLARVFRPGAAEPFEDIGAGRDAPLRLYEDLGALLGSARHAERHDGAEALLVFSGRFDLFRAGSLRHLMQEDS
jgi:hypothetical protein